MCFDYLLDFLFIYAVADLLERIYDVIVGYYAVVVSVELMEDCLEPLLSEEFLDVNRRCQKLTVVNLLITKVVQLRDDVLDFLTAHAQVPFLQVV